MEPIKPMSVEEIGNQQPTYTDFDYGLAVLKINALRINGTPDGERLCKAFTALLAVARGEYIVDPVKCNEAADEKRAQYSEAHQAGFQAGREYERREIIESGEYVRKDEVLNVLSIMINEEADKVPDERIGDGSIDTLIEAKGRIDALGGVK